MSYIEMVVGWLRLVNFIHYFTQQISITAYYVPDTVLSAVN